MVKNIAFLTVPLFCLVAYGNICIQEPVTVSKIRGHVEYVHGKTKFAARDEIRAELWETRSDGNRLLVTKTTTDSKGYFSFGTIKPGSYDLQFSSPAAREGFWVRVKGPNIFHWFRDNWLEIGLGLVQPEGCPPSYIRATRKKMAESF